MTNIQAIKIGNIVNISINGKLYKKNCGSLEEADELFKLVLEGKSNPSDDAIKKIRIALNEKLRIAYLTGLETDVNTGKAYLAGFNTPIPKTLLDVIEEYHENNYPMDAIINFWKLLMINPDKRVRTSLFNFISAHDFVLTDKGYMLVYKAVYVKEVEKRKLSAFEQFVIDNWNKVRKEWKCGANKYAVYKVNKTGEFSLSRYTTVQKWDEKKKGIEVIGKLGDLYSALIIEENKEETETVYTDMYSKTMSIVVGEPIKMPRNKCNGDPAVECSYGLHVGATKYVENWGNGSSTILACLVNPANVVAVPDHDKTKMRVTEYFPFAIANYGNGKIDIIEQKYFEDDYGTYEVDELEAQLTKLKAEELPIGKAQNCEEETRSMSELTKMIETRLVDIQ